VEPYERSVRFAEEAREQGLRRAVVSSSTNCRDVLVAAGIDHLFEERVDGMVAEREGLAGKPAPDTFLHGAKLLGAAPAEAAVFEDRSRAWRPGRLVTSATSSASIAPASATHSRDAAPIS
jgi:beta-phosphoglucomutase-like phosphatase (HAD superfamily)